MASYPCAGLLTMWWKIEYIIYKWSLNLIVDIHWHVFFLPYDQQISNEGWFCWSKSKIKFYVILWLPQKLVTENPNKSLIQNLWEKNYTWHVNIKHIKDKIFIVGQYTIAHIVQFFIQYHENEDKNNINHPPSQFLTVEWQ